MNMNNRINLVSELPVDFYNELNKYNLISDIEKILNSPSFISIDLNDIMSLSNSDIVGFISKSVDELNEDYNIEVVSDKTPNECLLHISSADRNLSLDKLEKIINKLKSIYQDINIIIGISTVPSLDKKIQIRLFLFSNN